jgi:transcriptional regulator with XRE-family HTH domain
MKQATLASALGLTFQQVQKYERGFNRVSASTLYEIARILNVAVADFYDDLPSTTDAAATTRALTHQPELKHMMGSPDGAIVAEFFPRIESPGLRRALAEVVRATARGRESS